MVHIGQHKQGNYWDVASYVEAFLLYGGLTCFARHLFIYFIGLSWTTKDITVCVPLSFLFSSFVFCFPQIVGQK